jgi:hypothetical protein
MRKERDESLQVLFIFELGIEARFVNPVCLFQIMKGATCPINETIGC